MAEIVVDTFNPEPSGFENVVRDPVDAPFKVTTGAGSLSVAGRVLSLPPLDYIYPSARDTYDDVILIAGQLGTGDGVTTKFSAALIAPVQPITYTTVQVTDGQSLLTDIPTHFLPEDDPNFTSEYIGNGVFQGEGTGTIGYENGLLEVTFNVAPAAGVIVGYHFACVQRTPVVNGALQPEQHVTSARLQRVVTDSAGVLRVDKLSRTEWDRHLIVTGRANQSREMNEIISATNYRVKMLGNTIFDDGDVNTGCAPARTGTKVVAGVTKTVIKISEGLIYLDGLPRRVPETEVLVDGVGEEKIGIRIIRSIITEDQDASLKNIATGFDGTGQPGAWREKVNIQWRVNDANAVPVFRLLNGEPLVRNRTTIGSDIERALAERTMDESGHYRCWGFRGSTRPRMLDLSAGGQAADDSNLDLDIDGGLAYVQGYAVNKPAATRMPWRKALDTRLVSGGFAYKPSGTPNKEIYDLDKAPVAGVSSVSTLARTPRMRITPSGNGTDDLPAQSVENDAPARQGSIYSDMPNITAQARLFVYPNTGYADGASPPAGFIENTDWHLDPSEGDKIIWDTAQPNTSYYAFWNYDTDNGEYPLVKGTRLYAEHTQVLSGWTYGVAVNLAKADLQAILQVKDPATGTLYSKGKAYTFKTGRSNTQTSNVGTITFLSTSGIVEGASIEVKFGYWRHDLGLWVDDSPDGDGEGDYTAPDSYLEESEFGQLSFDAVPGASYRVAYEKIPQKKAEDLRSQIDFRALGVGHTLAVGGRKIAVDGAGVGYQVDISYTFYLPRIDAVVLDRDGLLSVFYGESGVPPRPPAVSGEVLQLLQIYSKAASNYPRVTDASVTRQTMEDLQAVKHTVDRLEIALVTTALERDAKQAAGTFQIRGLFTDPFRNFDFMDLTYDQDTTIPVPASAWVANTVYVAGDEVKDLASPTLYLRCVQGGTSSNPSAPAWSTTVGGITTDNTCKWQTYAKTPFTARVRHDIAIDNRAGAIRFPTFISTPAAELRTMVDTARSSIAITEQLVMLPYTQVAVLNQPAATENELVNPYSTFEPVMNVKIEPAADFWVDTERAPDLISELPGSTVTNLSVGYTSSHQGAGIPSVSDEPVHRLPDTRPLGRINGWDNQFHVGVPIDIARLDPDLAGGVDSWVDADGHQNVNLQDGDPNFNGFGFVPQDITMSTSTDTQRVGDVVVSTALALYMRQRTIAISGELFPINTDITASFAGRTVALTLVPNQGEASPTPGAVRSVSDPNSPQYGRFVATFVIPPNVPVGSAEVVVKAAGRKRSVSYVAQGTVVRRSTLYTSVTTTTYDVVGSLCPVAQSFEAPFTGWVTSIELYFYAKDNLKGVEVQIRNMVNGYPGEVVLGKVAVAPSQIQISDDASKATVVTFPDPVYVVEGRDYCFAILDDSDQYRVWIARLGSLDVRTGRVVTKQNSIGVFFKSANNKTWDPDQRVDMKFTLKMARFNSTSGVLVFNDITDMVANRIMLVASQLLPPGTQIRWAFAIGNGAYVPISPGGRVEITGAGGIARTIRLIAVLIGYRDAARDIFYSPAINRQHMGIAGDVYVGDKAAADSEFSGSIEANYISENMPLTQAGFEEIKLITDEFVPAGTNAKAYFSVDDGVTWVAYPNSDAEEIEGYSSYADTELAGSVHERVRSQTFNPISKPTTPANVLSPTGGAFPAATYSLQYTFLTKYGESMPSDAVSVAVALNDKITFDLPSSTNWPEHASYNGGNPVRVSGINVYINGTKVDPALVSFTGGTLTTGDTVTVTNLTPAVPAQTLPTINTTVPLNFRTRLRLIAPYHGDLIPTPSAKLSPSGFTYGTTDGTIPGDDTTTATKFTVVVTFLSVLGETAPSPSHVAGDNIKAPAGTATNSIRPPAITFPALAQSARLYMKKLSEGGAERLITDLQVTRGGVVVNNVTDILRGDTNIKIKNVPPTLGTPKTPPTSNASGAITALAPQIRALRTIVHDES